MLLSSPLHEGERVAVMQIGAHLAWKNYNDLFRSSILKVLSRPGNGTDFLAVMVEPQPHVFERLRQGSKKFGAQVVVANAAVCAEGSGAATDFFIVDPSIGMTDGIDIRTGLRTARWTSQIASIDRSQVVKHMPKSLRLAANYSEDDYIKRVRVPCHSVADLTSRHGIVSHRFALLSIDAEGHDVRILRSTPLETILPWIINWEKTFATGDEICDLLEKLRRLGYSCECDTENMHCYHSRVRDAQLNACGAIPEAYEFTCVRRNSVCSGRYPSPAFKGRE